MHTARLAFVALALSLAGFAACGGSNPPSQAPVAVATPAPSDSAPSARDVGDAGAGSTTTQTLGGGAAGGMRMTPLAGDAGGDGGHVKHKPELGRSVADIQAILGSHRDEARACYDNALAGHPGIEGNLDVRWTIDPAGNVADAELDTSRSEIVEPAVVNCVVAIVKKLHFNVSTKGFETKSHYPFNFHPHTRHVIGN